MYEEKRIPESVMPMTTDQSDPYVSALPGDTKMIYRILKMNADIVYFDLSLEDRMSMSTRHQDNAFTDFRACLYIHKCID